MRFFCLLLILLPISALCLQAAVEMEEDGSIRLPLEKHTAIGNYAAENVSLSSGKRLPGIQAAGEMFLLRDRTTGSPRILTGSPVPVKGFSRIDKSNAGSAALSFLNSSPDLFRIGKNDELRVAGVAAALGKFYVHLKQYHAGEEVLLAKASVVLAPDGRVMACTASLFPDVSIGMGVDARESAISAGAAMGLELNQSKDVVRVMPGCLILPVADNGGVTYKRVRKVEISGPDKNFTSFVDVADAAPAWRINNILNNRKVKVTGSIHTVAGEDPKMTPLGNMHIYIDGKLYTTDSSGEAEFKESGAASGYITFHGPWVSINNDGSYPENIDFNPESTDIVELNNQNSIYYIRNVFKYVNDCHDFISKLDAGFKSMDFSTNVTIMAAGQPNGMSLGEAILLTGITSESLFVAKSPMVIYHEYTHNTNKQFYKWLGREDGMISLTCNEALADLYAGLMCDQPDPLVGITKPGYRPAGLLRDLRNKCSYPDSIEYDSHMNGRILAGAFWDLRKLLGIEKVEKLAHFARYSLPDDADEGMAFYEWLLATLIADDDDNDLSNGTPHGREIIQSFNIHGIGEKLFIAKNIRHKEMDDISNYHSGDKITISCTANSKNLFGKDKLNLSVMLQNSDGKGYTAFPMKAVNDTSFSTEISMAGSTALAKYYFICRKDGDTTQWPVYNNSFSNEDYNLLLGYKRVYYNECENLSGWNISMDASYGNVAWQVITPKYFPEYPPSSQFPGSDHSAAGSKCFSTGKLDSLNDIVNSTVKSRTEIFSPVMNLNKYNGKLAVRFFYWGYNRIVLGKVKGYLNFMISTDGGVSYKVIDTIRHEAEGWKRKVYLLDKYIPAGTPADNIKFCFSANNKSIGYSSGYCLTRFMIDDFEILADSEVISVENAAPADRISLAVSPNPLGGQARVLFNPGCGSYDIVLYDAAGREVQKIAHGTGTGSAMEITWDASALGAGMYYMKLVAGAESVVVPVSSI